MRRPLALLALLAAAASVVGACGGGTTFPPASTASPAGSPSLEASAPPMPTPARSLPGPVVPSQTDTEWGRIWDALPDGFPVPPGSTPTEPDEPVSGAFDLSVGVDEAATFMQQTLELANFSTFTMSGPAEDGSIVIESVGPGGADCRVETTIRPLGAVTRMTVRYGAACAFG
jgi:hypothetical protein